jgi:hypothetical protein
MNRRAFLKLFVGSVAVATLPIPRFLLKEEPDTALVAFAAWKGELYDASSGVLTAEMIEEASRRAMENHGKPTVVYMSPARYNTFLKHFGYKVVYE